VEVASPVYEEITRVLYDPKFSSSLHPRDRTRTFCTNPGAAFAWKPQRFRLVNGDALKTSRRRTRTSPSSIPCR